MVCTNFTDSLFYSNQDDIIGIGSALRISNERPDEDFVYFWKESCSDL